MTGELSPSSNSHMYFFTEKLSKSYEVNDGDYKMKNKGSVPTAKRKAGHNPERILFCGWRRDMSDMISQVRGTCSFN